MGRGRSVRVVPSKRFRNLEANMRVFENWRFNN
jgi:hypothetical protein